MRRGDGHRPRTIEKTAVIRAFSVAAITSVLSLTACSTAKIEPACPALIPWSTDFQKQIASELRANPKLVALPEVTRQAVVMRDQIRACGAKP